MKENKMIEIKIEKVTLNCGTGTEKNKLEKSMKLLQLVSGKKPVKTTTQKRIPAFQIRPGLEIGCKVTIRKAETKELLKRLFEAIGNKLNSKQINPGSFSFGIKEYLEIPGIIYQRDIGMAGLEVCVTFTRAGLKIKKRKAKKGKIPKRQKITKEETIAFIKENLNVEVE